MNPNWVRWIKASLAKHFDSKKENIPLIVDGFNRPAKQPSILAELRLEGPVFREVQKGRFIVTVHVNVIVTSTTTNDGYHLERHLGIIAAAFTNAIVLYKLGDGLDDNSSQELGCLSLQGEVIVQSFGLVMEDNMVYQGSVDGQYTITLETQE